MSSIGNTISKGFSNTGTPSNKFTFFGSNFNMPIAPSIFTGSFVRFAGYTTPIGAATTYDLTGFTPGFEICVGMGLIDFDNTGGGSPLTVNGTLTVQWLAPNGTTVLGTNSQSISNSIPAAGFFDYFLLQNIGFETSEISTSATYFFKTIWSGVPTIASTTTSISFTNVPSITTLTSADRGYIWVEGNNLAYVNANQWKHSIAGTLVGATNGSQDIGYIWLDGTDLHWVGADTNNYKQPWKVAQFASFFSNSATGPAPGTPLPSTDYGSLWADSEFGQTHLAYIGTDGSKYLTGMGINPYV